MSPIANRRKRKEAYLTFQEDWRIYSEELGQFLNERTYRMLPMTCEHAELLSLEGIENHLAPLFRELMEEPASEQVPATASTSALSLSAVLPMENDRQSVTTSETTEDWQSFMTFDTEEHGTPRARLQGMMHNGYICTGLSYLWEEIPELRIQEFDPEPEGIRAEASQIPSTQYSSC
jgi:hypothetical protein